MCCGRVGAGEADGRFGGIPAISADHVYCGLHHSPLTNIKIPLSNLLCNKRKVGTDRGGNNNLERDLDISAYIGQHISVKMKLSF